MSKNKGEKAYLVVFPTDKDGGKALDLLCAEGRVYGVLYQGIPATVVTESQLKRLDRAGIRWKCAKGLSKNNLYKFWVCDDMVTCQT